MLQWIVGNVDLNSALVLAVLFVVIGVICTSLIVKRRSATVISNEFELAKIKQRSDDAARLYGLETDRDYKTKQLQQNLITSHKVDR